MTAHPEIGPISQQYSAAATVPLIKSPSLWLPKPVELSNDIHPLPEDITAYFVYPFTLEQHVLSIHPSPHEAIAQRRARNAQILHQREIEEEQKEKEALHKLAPGYNPSSLLVPTSTSRQPSTQNPGPTSQQGANPTGLLQSSESTATAAADPMDELVAQLEQMERGR
ncbi:hypothetical protein DB88DRAFT_491322 [Papiliotrema laurentii]|uniref:Uncharacterized protein n=1 Tax=Papiliotrema laurentii TaxID=5418 RepID=A0AAD9FNL5_PAPLA|nr:hypothetical protein DB88DRAFT_491322 [Papiliotrema laurentii]